MTLVDVNQKLIETDEKLATALTKLFPLETQYQSRLDELELSSQRGNQTAREAEARQILMTEPLYVEYQTAKLEVKILYIRLDTLREVSRNMRNLAFSEN